MGIITSLLYTDQIYTDFYISKLIHSAGPGTGDYIFNPELIRYPVNRLPPRFNKDLTCYGDWVFHLIFLIQN